ncbi:polysaccharide pyruvyl transferase family protein [Shewanella sp. MF08487]|uniref:polysaccharide pyruvyl transferase family protein n=1 Tax=Shewanella sp. MF08487 TaxID=3434873 RepID=UPI003D7ABA7B
MSSTSIMKRVKLYYFNSFKNFGDLLSASLFEKIAGLDVTGCDAKGCDVVGVGSLLQRFLAWAPISLLRRPFNSSAVVWGSGFMNPPKTNKSLFRHLDVFAVRGHRTLSVLQQLDHVNISNKVAIGDPGLLASCIFDTSHVPKKYALGIVAHYKDKDHPLLKNVVVENATVIDISQDPLAFMLQLAECENVIASAMHALIAADSLGIPNVRMTTKETGVGDYKFDDYYSAFNLSEHEIINLNHRSFLNDDLKKIKENYKVSPEKLKEIQRALIESFPIKNAEYFKFKTKFESSHNLQS